MRGGLTEAVLNTRPFDRGFESDHVNSFVRALPPDLSPKLYSPQISEPRVKLAWRRRR